MLKFFCECEDYAGRLSIVEVTKPEFPGGIHGVERWRIYQQEITAVDKEEIVGKKKYQSWRYYGCKVEVEEIPSKFPKISSLLLLYMQSQGWKSTVRTPSGRWFPLDEGDEVIPIPQKEEKKE